MLKIEEIHDYNYCPAFYHLKYNLNMIPKYEQLNKPGAPIELAQALYYRSQVVYDTLMYALKMMKENSEIDMKKVEVRYGIEYYKYFSTNELLGMNLDKNRAHSSSFLTDYKLIIKYIESFKKNKFAPLIVNSRMETEIAGIPIDGKVQLIKEVAKGIQDQRIKADYFVYYFVDQMRIPRQVHLYDERLLFHAYVLKNILDLPMSTCSIVDIAGLEPYSDLVAGNVLMNNLERLVTKAAEGIDKEDFLPSVAIKKCANCTHAKFCLEVM